MYLIEYTDIDRLFFVIDYPTTAVT